MLLFTSFTRVSSLFYVSANQIIIDVMDQELFKLLEDSWQDFQPPSETSAAVIAVEVRFSGHVEVPNFDVMGSGGRLKIISERG